LLRRHIIKYFFVALLVSFQVSAQPKVLQNLRKISPHEKYVVTNWNSNNGLPQNSINKIIQDKSGFIWLATYGGLVRFDGKYFKTYTVNEYPGLQSDRIVSIFLDSKNRIWISNEIGKLIIFDGKTFLDITKKFTDEFLLVYQFAEDSKGGFYLAGLTNDLYYYLNNTVKRFDFSSIQSIPSKYFNFSFGQQTKNDTLFVIHNEYAMLLHHGAIVKHQYHNKLVPYHILSIYNEFGIWFVHNNKLHYAKDFEYISTASILFPEKSFYSLYAKDSTIIANTTKNEIVEINKNQINTIMPSGQILVPEYARLFIDSENSYWAGTPINGVYLIKKKFLYTLDETYGISQLNTYPLLKSLDGTIWIGQNTGLQWIQKNKILSYTSEVLPTSWGLAEDKSKNIWIATNGGGIQKYDGKRFNSNLLGDSVQGAFRSFFSAYTDNGGKVWFGSIGAVITYFNGEFKIYNPGKNKQNIYKQFLEDKNGALWITSDQGLYKFQNEGFDLIEEADAKFSRALYVDKKERMWVGTYGNGLRIKIKNKFISLNQKTGLFSDIVSAIVEDGRGNFWFTCNNGLFRIREREIEDYLAGKIDRVNSINYGTAEGLYSVEFNGGCQPSWMQDDEGNLWLPSFGGPVIVDLNSFNDIVKEPSVFIESLNFDRRLYYPGDNIEIPHDYSNFNIAFNSPSFSSPQNVHYKYRLLGLDKKWHEHDGRREVTYQKLPYGDYEFQILASDSYGNWSSQPASIKFSVNADFFETPFFYFLIFLLIIAVVFLLFNYRLRRAKARQIALEKIIADRTQNLKSAKEEAEAAAENEKALRAEAEEDNRQKNEILRIVSHDLKNPLSSIKGFVELLLEEGELNSSDREVISMVGDAGGRMQRLITQLLNFSRFEENRIIVDKTEINVTSEIDNVLEHFTTEALKKNQPIIKNYMCSSSIIFADITLFTQIIENLVSNAIKYSEPYKSIHINVLESESKIIIEIKDNGQGFSKEDVDNLYKPFVQLSSLPTGGEQSTGLGLAIVKKFVELNDGIIKLESQKGIGSTFILEFSKASDF